MPNGQAFDDAVQIAIRNPGLGIGIHLALVGERALVRPERLGGLVDAHGNLPASYELFVLSFLRRRFSLHHIEQEIDAQLTRALQSGLSFTHIDSHQHLHMLPGLLPRVIAIAGKAGIRYLRLPLEQPHGRMHPLSLRGLHLAGLTVLSRASARQYRHAGIAHADHFWGLSASGHLNEPALLELLASLRPGVNEIMCHPGESDHATRTRYAWGYRWDEEALALRAQCVLQMVAERKIRLRHFGEIFSPDME